MKLWFQELARTGEALKFVHYMFKERLSHIDYCYINIYDLKQLYDDCLAGKVNPTKLDKQVLDFFGF